MKPHKRALLRAAEAVGSQGKLAKELGVVPQSIGSWIHRDDKQLPVRHVLTIEKLTRGLVKRWELRPDIYPPPRKKASSTGRKGG